MATVRQCGNRTGGRRQRTGVSLVEVMVCMAVMGLLMSLLLPAVQYSREAARRAQCQNNLHQLAVAMSNHEAEEGRFPGDYAALTWEVHMLPYLDPAFKAELPWVNPSPDYWNNTYPFFKCPTDPLAKGELFMHENSYFICGGANAFRNAADGFSPGFNADGVRARDITDGLSNTVAFSERLVWPEYAGSNVDVSQFPQEWPRLVLDVRGPFSGQTEFVEACHTSARPLVPMRWTGGREFRTSLSPNNSGCDGGVYRALSATSLHTNGVNVLFADGSGRFISNGIDMKLWNALGTRAGNEPLSLSAY